MSRSTRGASSRDAQLRSIPDDHILDFLAAARRRLAEATPREAAGFRAATASLEAEAARRGLEQAAPHERTPLWLVVRRLSAIAPTEYGGEWARLLVELDLPGLWVMYLHAQDRVAPEYRVAALAQVVRAVDRIVFPEKAAHARYLKHVELPTSAEARLAKLNAALEETFGLIFDRMAGTDPEE